MNGLYKYILCRNFSTETTNISPNIDSKILAVKYVVKCLLKLQIINAVIFLQFLFTV